MRRRDISTGLFAAAAGASLLPRATQAQSCTLPCYPATAAEIAAGITPVSLQYPPDGTDTLNVFRYFSGTQISNVLAGVLTDVSAPLQAAINFLEGRVATNAGGKTTMNGGTLFLPGGLYYCGTTGIRVGGNVKVIGNQYNGTQLAWSNSFSGNCVTIGPDESGFYGYSGVYAMGAAMESCTISCGNSSAWGIYTTGMQQGCHLRDMRVTNVNNGGIYLQDHHGSAYIKVSDTYIFGSATSGAAVGIHCDGGACIELNQVSMNGSPTQPFLRGIEYVGGGLLVTDFECENTITHIDIAGTAGENSVVIDSASLNLSNGGAQGIWIHSGFIGTIAARGVSTGPYGVALRNDNTNEQKSAQAGGGIFGQYVWSGTATDVSVLQNTIVVPPLQQVNPPSTTILDVGAQTSFSINVAHNYGFTIGPPAMGSNVMPTSGRNGQRILVKIRNVSGASLGSSTLWDPVFKMSSWTNPANGFSRAVEFEWDGTHWVQLWQATADVPN